MKNRREFFQKFQKEWNFQRKRENKGTVCYLDLEIKLCLGTACCSIAITMRVVLVVVLVFVAREQVRVSVRDGADDDDDDGGGGGRGGIGAGGCDGGDGGGGGGNE